MSAVGEPYRADVPAALDGVRVDRAVSMLLGVSRSTAAAMVADGVVCVGGTVVTSRGVPLREGDQLLVQRPHDVDTTLVAEDDVAFTVVHADRSLVVVDKPPGLVVHPGAGQASGTLIAGLLARYPDIAELSDEVCEPERPGIVHRLDKGTSGLLVVARTPEAYESLGEQFRERTVGRRYVALVAGHVAEQRGVVDAPIGRSQRTPTRMAVTAGGRAARTTYEVIERLELGGAPGSPPIPVTLLACRLETGRTHQIRVHMAAVGHPVAGDDRYGQGRRRVLGSLLPAGRVFLHAASLAVDHPTTGERMSWESELPADLARVVRPGDTTP